MPASRPGTARRLLRALLCAVVLTALLAGLPWLLYATTTAVWTPGTEALAHLFTRQDTGAAFMLTLCAIGWTAWASFTLSVLLEIPAQLRGRCAPSLPGLRLSQRAAGTLISGILVAFASSTLASATPALATPATAASASAEAPRPATAVTPAHDTAETASAQRAAERTYTVRDTRPAESLWSIAEKLYGHGELYTKIAEANEGRTMPGGAVFHADATIQPGWVLTLPDASRTDVPEPPARPATASTYTVRGGDTLWKVAEDQLGDGERYGELFEANEGARQPDGSRLTDPDEIQAGLTLTLPPTAAPPKTPGTATPPPASPPTDNRPAGPDATPSKPAPAVPAPSSSARPGGTPATDIPKTPPAATVAPSAKPTPASPANPSFPVVTTPAPAVPAQPGKTAPPAVTPAPEHPAAPETVRDKEDTEETGAGDIVGQAVSIGMLVAGCLLMTLGLKRMLQRRRRAPGELPATADTAAEQALHVAADPGSIELLDLALRTLAHHAAEDDRQLPAVAGARITARTVELLLPETDNDDGESESDSGQVPAPFIQDGPGRWALDRTQPLLDIDTASRVPAPYPGLITLGTDPDGNHLLINLTTVRVLLLDGTPTAVRDTARVLALEAATSTWSDHSEIITVGLGDQLPPLLPQSRMRAVPRLAAARADLVELLLEQRQTADGGDAPARLPWTLVCAAEIDEDEARLLADTLTAARDLPVALVVPAQGTSGAFGALDDAVHLAVGTTRTQYVDVLDADLLVQSLSENDYEDFLDLLRQAEKPARLAEGPWRAVPPVHISLTDTDESAAGPAVLPSTPFAAFTATRPLTSVPPLPAPAPEKLEVFPPTPPSPGEDAAHTAADAPTGKSEPSKTEESGSTDTDTAPPATEPESGTREPAEPVDLHAPEVQILGPVTVTGIASTGHGPKLAQLAAYLYFKPGEPDTVREAMDPRSPWSKPTLQTRISQLRNQLGTDPDGTLYLPRDRTGTYRLSPKVRCDWDRFTTLAERGLTKGPSTGIGDLEAALALVRGYPFGTNPPAWAAARVQEILVRITDTAHTLATWHRTGPRPDLDAARRAVRRGLDVDDSAELLYRDWMLIEDQAGNHQGIRAAYDAISAINRRLDVSTEPETDDIYERLVTRSA
ncbi:LysM peptidoglycan-binding domain-containing protein [Streptomyces sp. NPDC057242]|uniref:LysM peptidoglycan-binding domain-containing protein n=1 Tax=unclassified Streptomyces TaxID=2593676 RepID=UPI00363462C2